MNLATMKLRPDVQRRLAEDQSTEIALASPHNLAAMCQFCGYLGFCAIIRLRLRRIWLICEDCRLEQRETTPEVVRVRAENLTRHGAIVGLIPGNRKAGTPESEREELRGW